MCDARDKKKSLKYVHDFQKFEHIFYILNQQHTRNRISCLQFLESKQKTIS